MPTVQSVSAMIRKNGRPMVLRRVTQGQPDIDCDVIGITHGAMPDDIVSNVAQQTTAITIRPDELIAAGWPLPPRANDRVVRDTRTQTVQGVEPVYLRGTVCKYVLSCKG